MPLLLGGSLLGCDRAATPAASSADTLTASLEVTVGGEDGASEYLFGRIVGVATSDAGVIYVADELGSSVRAYDRTGAFLGRVASEGDGPGELRYLLGLDIDPAGRLHVRGAFRVSVFARSAEGAFADSLARTVPVQGGTSDRLVRGRAGELHFYVPSYVWEGFQRRGYFYLAYDSVGAIADTIFVPPFPDPESTGVANYPVNDQGFGVNVAGIGRVPFEPRPSWDMTDDGHVWFTTGDRYEILEVGPDGDTLQTIRSDYRPWSVSNDERSDSSEAFTARLDSVPVPLDDVRGLSALARRRELPTTVPPILALQVGVAGNLWVRRWPRSGVNETVWDIFDPSGAHDYTVVVPAALLTHPTPWLAGEVIAGVVEDAATGVQRVGVFRLSGR